MALAFHPRSLVEYLSQVYYCRCIVWLGVAGGIIWGMDTLLVPNAGNPIERVQYIAAVIKTNLGYGRPPPCEIELFPLEWIVKSPFTAEALQLGQLCNANVGAGGKLFLIWLHRKRST